MEKEKVFIFVSHSHEDLEKVRLIRNHLESLGAEPILFFLKSKTDKDEIIQLIRDEIDARLWFIYCRSDNAENSTWCQDEVNYVKKTGKMNITINLDFCLDENNQLNILTKEKLNIVVNGFRELQTIFLSHHHRDASYANLIREELINYGIDVWECNNNLTTLDNWSESIGNAIHKANYFLMLVSDKTINSNYVFDEIRQAREENKPVFSIVIFDGVDYSDRIPPEILGTKYYIFDVRNEKKMRRALFSLFNSLIEFIILQNRPLN